MLELYNPELFSTILALAKRMRDESAFKVNGWNEQKIKELLAQPNVFCAMVKDASGDYFGFFVGASFEHFFSNDTVAGDLALYVTPEKRGTSAAPRMVQAFEHWAQARGITELYLGQSTGVEVERTRKLYEKLGYTVVGFQARKETSHVR